MVRYLRLKISENLFLVLMINHPQYYKGFHGTYRRITIPLYLRHLAKHLRTHVDGCPEHELE